MNFNHLIRIPLVCTGLLAISTTAHALPFGNRGGQVMREFQELREDLNLSRSQKSRIREILMAHQEEIHAQRTAAKDARSTMKSAMETHGADSTQADKAADGIARTAKSRALLVATIFSEIRPILTPEQIRKLEAARTSFLSKGL